MVRFTKIPPIFNTARTEQAADYPKNFELPDNVPPIVFGPPDAAQDHISAEHGRPADMPETAADDGHAQPAFQAAPPAEALADDHANLDLPDPLPPAAATSAHTSPDLPPAADNADADHPEVNLPDEAAIDDPFELVDDHATDRPEPGDHGAPDDLPDHAPNAVQIPAEYHAPEDGAAGGAEDEAEDDAEDSAEDGEQSQSDAAEDAAPETTGPASVFLPTTGDEFLGLPMIFVEYIPQLHDDDSEESDPFDFFL